MTFEVGITSDKLFYSETFSAVIHSIEDINIEVAIFIQATINNSMKRFPVNSFHPVRSHFVNQLEAFINY